jgi:hypothetical protein
MFSVATCWKGLCCLYTALLGQQRPLTWVAVPEAMRLLLCLPSLQVVAPADLPSLLPVCWSAAGGAACDLWCAGICQQAARTGVCVRAASFHMRTDGVQLRPAGLLRQPRECWRYS